MLVEDKGVTATIHYRQTDLNGEQILAAVRDVLEEYDQHDVLCISRGKKVVELRPDIDWGKGDTVELLCEYFTPDDERWVPVYIGDDTTDESAFEAVGEEGIGVAVGSDTDATAASSVVCDPSEATDLLCWLAEEGLANLGTAQRDDRVVVDGISE